MKASSSEAAKIIQNWLDRIGDPSWDPWPEELSVFENLVSKNEPICIDPIAEKSDEQDVQSYKGKKDELGRFDEFGTVTYHDGDVLTSEFRNGFRHGDAVILSPRKNLARLVGTYIEGQLEGKGNFFEQRN